MGRRATGTERIGDPREARLEPGQIGGVEAVEEEPADAVEMGRRRLSEPAQAGRCQDGLLAAGIGLAGDALHGAGGLEAVDQPGDPAARQDHAVGQDVHPDATAGSVRDLEERVVLGQ